MSSGNRKKASHVYRFYCLRDDLNKRETNKNSDKYVFQYWRPRWRCPLPPNNWSIKYWIWFVFHWLGIFKSKDYGVAIICFGNQVIHHSCVFPRYFRFPFMEKSDLQIGDVWTDPSARGKGLATAALKGISQMNAGKGRGLWYIVEETNKASIKVVENAGFEMVGLGEKHARFGIRLFGYYSIDHGVTVSKRR